MRSQENKGKHQLTKESCDYNLSIEKIYLKLLLFI